MKAVDPGLVQEAMRHTLVQQQQAFAHAPWPGADVRRQTLRRLREALQVAAPVLIDAIAQDFGGRSTHESQMLELFPALDGLRYAERHLARWMRDERRHTGLFHLPGQNRLLKQPLGVVGVIVPWNFPLYLAVGPLTSALAAGNRAMLKLSEFTPCFAERFAEMIAHTFSPEQVAVVNGGPEVAAAFAGLPFDHLLFTGSTAVGRQVMAAASANLTPVTLELGGKSPVIVGPECDPAFAAKRLMFGKCANAGQICVAPDYVLLPQGRERAFLDAARAEVRRMYPTLRDNPDYSSIVNDRHVARLQGLLDDALAQGAHAEPLHPDHDPARRRLPPTLVFDVHDGMRIQQEEIFGPWLPVVPYAGLDQAIAYANARPKPLALYYLGQDRAHQQQVIRRTISGGVSINHTLLHVAQDDLPFGGVGASGMGHYHGYEGFLALSKLRGVHRVRRLASIELLKPPYGKRFAGLMRWMLR